MKAILPILIFFVFGYALLRKRPIFSDFCQGVSEGLHVCLGLFPTLLLMMVSIGVFRASGAMDFFVFLLEPLCGVFRFPSGLLPLVLVRPLSGGGALSLCESLLRTYGAESLIGRMASVLCASTETTFYTLGVYLPDGGGKGSGKLLFCALLCDLFVVFLTVFVCNIL